RRDQQVQPTEREGGGVSIGGAQEHVGAARPRQHAAELGQGERAAQAHDPEADPEGEDGDGIADVLGQRVGLAEDAAADRDPDDEGEASPEADHALQIVPRRMRRGDLHLRPPPYRWLLLRPTTVSVAAKARAAALRPAWP